MVKSSERNVHILLCDINRLCLNNRIIVYIYIYIYIYIYNVHVTEQNVEIKKCLRIILISRGGLIPKLLWYQ